MVILGIEGKDVREEGDLGVVEEGGGLAVLSWCGGKRQEREEGLTVVPGIYVRADIS